MVKNYYEILGVPSGADQKQIKRAYFKLVRQFSPEKDPERFQEIREAYENLQGTPSDDGLQEMEVPDNQMAASMMNQIQHCIQCRDFDFAIRTAKEALACFGEWEAFLFYQALAQRLSGHSGLAAKNFERLAAKYPQKRAYRRHLAIAYLDRGFGKKAYQAFKDAYNMGCRDPEFLQLYGLCCRDRKKPEEGIQLLLELVENGKKKIRDSVNDLLEAYVALYDMDIGCSGKYFHEISARLLEFLQSASVYLQEYVEETTLLIPFLMMDQGAFGHPDDELFLKIKKELNRILPQDLSEKIWETIGKKTELQRIEEDERLSDLMKRGADAFFNDYDEPSFLKFMQLDTKLCILEEWPGIQKEFAIIGSDYPCFYSAIKDFIELLNRTTDIGHLRARLLKDYDRLERYYDCDGFYYEIYPERRKASSSSLWDSSEGTFTRQQPKVGRNAPCPCGSGKKYKNCCGKNT